jgi:tetratricopeptide (TPR) repeat protein
MAFEEAAKIARKAVTLSINAQSFPDGLRLDVLLMLAEAEMRMGHRERARSTLRDAVSVAEALESAERIGEVALAISPGFFAMEVGVEDPYVIDLLERAIGAVARRNDALEARLLARLGMALYWTRRSCDRVRSVEKAKALAVRSGSGSVLAEVRCASCMALWTAGNTEERLSLAEESVRRAAFNQLAETALMARVFLITSQLESGRGVDARNEIAAFSRAVGDYRLPQVRWYVNLFRSMLAVEAGDLGVAQVELQQLAAHSRQYPDANVEQSMGVLTALIAWLKGDAGGAVPVIDRIVQDYPGLSVWRAARALAQIDAGRHAEAAAEVEALCANECADVADDMMRTVTLCLLSYAVFELGGESAAGKLYELLAGQSQGFAVAGYGVCTWGSVARVRGRLAGFLGQYDRALEHFTTAQQLEARAGSLVWLAETQTCAAEALLGRGRSRDRAQARDLLGRAGSFARERGLIRFVHRVEACLSRFGA